MVSKLLSNLSLLLMKVIDDRWSTKGTGGIRFGRLSVSNAYIKTKVFALTILSDCHEKCLK